MTRADRVGVYGGTFNPIHVGHLRAAEEVAEALDLERIIFVPSAQPPHKRASGNDPIAPAGDRLAWVHAAVADNPRFEVDALEVERGGPSFAVETLRTIGQRTAPQRPVFIIGHDAFVELDSWRDPELLLTQANFAVTSRPPGAEGSLAEWLPDLFREVVDIAPDGLSGRHREAGTWIRLIAISQLDVSSSDLRARLREGRSVRYLIPDAVIEAIAKSGAYTGSEGRSQRA
ncbi:MAG: nicotinate-nucleotide adenylyltransferase [Myxococcota bacterium]